MNGTLRIEIDGTSAGVSANGISFAHAADIDGLVINNFSTGAGVSGGVDGIGISRCYIGTDITGLLPHSNRDGIVLSGGNNDLVSGCLISGNNRRGIELSGVGTSTLSGNYIGVDKTGSSPMPNTSHGIWLNSGSVGNTIGQQPANGCTLPTFGINIVAYNGGDGIRLAGSTFSDQNRILANTIFANEGLGIDLDGDLVTLNDNLDPDAGNNLEQNYPVLVSRSGNTIYGNLKSAPNQTFTVQFYWNLACDDAGFGQGQQYLGFKSGLTTDGTGIVIFNFTCGAIPAGGFVTALATDANGNTSEFSKCLSSPPTAVGDTPPAFALGANVPNPFNPSTIIPYRVSATSRVYLAIYDASGALVKTLVDDVRSVGAWTVSWNGEDDRGARAASGIYFCRMRAGSFDQTRKMVLLK
jgi:parallel beta-helix repeat protein